MQTTIHSFQDLQIYQLAFKCSVEVYEQAQQFPEDADIRVARKLLATSRAVRAHIAAAWGKRSDRQTLITKLSAAQFEATEMQIWIEGAIAAGYLDAESGQDLCDRYRHISTALDQLMEKAAVKAQSTENFGNTLPASA